MNRSMLFGLTAIAVLFSIAIEIIGKRADAVTQPPGCGAGTGPLCYSVDDGNAVNDCHCPSDGHCNPNNRSLSITRFISGQPCQYEVAASWNCSGQSYGQATYLEYADTYGSCTIDRGGSQWSYTGIVKYQGSSNSCGMSFTTRIMPYWSGYCGACADYFVLKAVTGLCD